MAAVAAILIALAAAHHSVLPYDGSTPVTIEGVVVRVLWQDPHALIAIDVPVAGGLQASGAERWTIESEGATALKRLGWTRDSLKTGDRILVTGARAKDGRRLMRCTTIRIDGRQLPCFMSPS